jgi:FKBP-type peptidyl-prolyl cis-trans isomerase 2
MLKALKEGSMKKAKKGDKVRIHYTLKLEGEEFIDTSKSQRPVEFSIGRGGFSIPDIEKHVLGMEEGEKKTVKLPPEKAYGRHRKELVGKVKKEDIPFNISPVVGHQLLLKKPDKSLINAMVTDIDEEIVEFDANHPLAGSTLVFDILLKEII